MSIHNRLRCSSRHFVAMGIQFRQVTRSRQQCAPSAATVYLDLEVLVLEVLGQCHQMLGACHSTTCQQSSMGIATRGRWPQLDQAPCLGSFPVARRLRILSQLVVLIVEILETLDQLQTLGQVMHLLHSTLDFLALGQAQTTTHLVLGLVPPWVPFRHRRPLLVRITTSRTQLKSCKLLRTSSEQSSVPVVGQLLKYRS